MVEYIGEKTYLAEILAAEQVWVARGPHRNIYAQETDDHGFSVPTWSSRERLESYLKVTLLWQRFEPHAIPLKEFADSWLSDQMKGIAEVQVNPVGLSSRVLVLTAEEFQQRVP